MFGQPLPVFRGGFQNAGLQALNYENQAVSSGRINIEALSDVCVCVNLPWDLPVHRSIRRTRQHAGVDYQIAK